MLSQQQVNRTVESETRGVSRTKSAKTGGARKVVTSSSEDGLAMVIDSKVNKGDEGIFYFLPTEMSKLGLLNPERFDSCEIRNVEVDDIRASALVGILSALKPNAPVSVLVCQPIAVMQPYEARMIESNAKLAGFVNIKTSPATFFDDYSGQDEETLCVTFNKPEKVVL